MSQSRRSRSKEAPRRRETLGTAIACNLEDAAGHTSPASADHPESQERLKCIVDHLKAVGLWDKCQFLDMPPAVDEGDLQQTHDKEYIASMAATERQSQDDLNQLASSFDSVYLCQGSYRASTSAVTCTRHLAESIVENKMRNGFALVRPPGHHAQKAHANGYCVFNSAASAAEAAFNFGAERILIVDFDVHHGQGTQQIFYEDERILYFSIHRYENGAYWPHLRESNFDFIGEGRGSGFNVNVPLNEVGCDNADYSAVFWSVLWPIANEFNPDLVIISAGFDACIGDPLGGMAVTPAFFGHMVYHLSDFAQGKIMLALEGGYNRNMLPVCVENCVRVLLGEQPTQIPPIGAAKESTIASILNVISVLRKYWRCFDFYSTASAKCKWDRHDTVVEYSPKLSTPTGPIDQRTLLCPEKLVPSPLEKERTTALAYDPLMTRHHNETEHHVECPERITSIYEQLNEGGLVEQCVKLEGRLATEAELELVHDRPHVRRMKRTATLSAAERRREEDNFNSIYFSPDSFDCALRSCGGVLQCVDAVLTGKSANAFAVVRPPGHHATVDEPYGFCLFNNVAVAAQYAIDKHKLQRVLILDWDVHHGNGIQQAFYEDPRILYVSLHRYDNGTFFPIHSDSDYHNVGKKAGVGFNVNIPWSNAQMGDREYMAAFAKIVMPIAYEFAPELVFVSAGFDAAMGDPLGRYLLTPSGYSCMTHLLSGLANGKVVIALEGGYNLKSISNSAEACVRSLLGNATPKSPIDIMSSPKNAKTIRSAAWKTIRDVAGEQEKYWKCLSGLQKIIAEMRPTGAQSDLNTTDQLAADLESLSVS